MIITGPVCVIPGSGYQYNLSANWTDSSTLRICVEGGTITLDNVSGCYEGGALSYVRLIWFDSIAAGAIHITSFAGDTTFSVHVTDVLSGGEIDSSVSLQIYDSAFIPLTLTCAEAAGGNCSPHYAYQWQQSGDNLFWADITGAIGKDFSFSSPITQTLHLRRKVTETISNSIAYSHNAVIIIKK